MSKKIGAFLSSWLPPLILMGTIFFLSSDKRPPLASIPLWNFIFYKGIHICVFATLYASFFRAFYRTRHKDMVNIYIFSFMATILYAAFDEFHQSFVPGRDGNPQDVAIDTLGASFVYFFIKHNLAKIKKFL